MELELKIDKLNFVEEGDKVKVNIGKSLNSSSEDKQNISFTTQILEVNSLNRKVEVITDFSPPKADDNETVCLYATKADRAYTGQELAFFGEAYAVFPQENDSYEIKSIQIEDME